MLLATAVCFKAVADAYLGGTPDWRRSLRFAVRRLGGLLGLSLLGGVLILLGLLALIVPGIWLAVAFAVGRAGAAARADRARGPRCGAPSGSCAGAGGRLRARSSSGYLLIAVIGALLQGVIMIVPSVLADGNTLVSALGAVVGGTVSSALTTPYSAAVVTLVYFDLRVRKEGLDLQLLASDAGVERDLDAPLPAPLVADEYTPEERAEAPFWPPPPGWTPPSRARAAWHREPRAGAEPPSWRPASEAPPQASGWLPPRPERPGDAGPSGE